MIDIGISKLMVIGVIALVFLGPEKLPRVARTAGTLLGRAQRYVNEVKAEVSQQMDLEEINKMKRTVEEAARNVETSVAKGVNDTDKEINNLWNDKKLDQVENASDKGLFPPQKPPTGTLTNLTPKPVDTKAFVQTPSPLQSHAQAKIKAIDLAERKRELQRKKDQHQIPWRSQRTAAPLWYKRRSKVKSALLSSAAKHTKNLP